MRDDLRGVGANLQDHLQLRSTWAVRAVATLNSLSRRWSSRLAMAAEYLLRRSGPLSMAPSQLGIFMRNQATQAHADLEFHVQTLCLPAFGEPLDPFDAITLSICHLNPRSRGHRATGTCRRPARRRRPATARARRQLPARRRRQRDAPHPERQHGQPDLDV